MPDLKLGSNWKSCGYLFDMRRWSHGNARINFGFCKGDDNFGGGRRKNLDDFCKSLGKQMNLVMYRMADTENLRMKLRERTRSQIREKATREEEREKAQIERLERNRKWREKKVGKGGEEDGAEEKELDEKEKRKEKNKEWREKRNSRDGLDKVAEKNNGEKLTRFGILVQQLVTELQCPFCEEEMAPPTTVWQCEEGHNLCNKCRELEDMQTCPLCEAEFLGRNLALERMALLLLAEEDVEEETEENEETNMEWGVES